MMDKLSATLILVLMCESLFVIRIIDVYYFMDKDNFILYGQNNLYIGDDMLI